MKRDKDERKDDIFFVKNVSEHPNPPDELAQNVSKKKNPFGRILPPFFFESSESDGFFNYLHDSNSIFRVGRINSENISARTVTEADRFFLLVVSLRRGTGVIFVQTLVHCSFLTRCRRNTACAFVDSWRE